MNRRYTIEDFKKVCILLRKAYPNVNLTTDIIVGFPGETDEEFNKTFEALKEINFYKMHVFKYSQRKGTKAAVMPNQIDGSIKEKRSNILIDLSDENEINIGKKYISSTVDVLFEEEENGFIKGHTTNYMTVKVPYQNIENTIKKVKILSQDGIELVGEIIDF